MNTQKYIEDRNHRVMMSDAPSRLFSSGGDSLIVGRDACAADDAGEACELHGPQGTRYARSSKIVYWPGRLRSFVITGANSRRARGMSVGMIWLVHTNRQDIEEWDALQLSIRFAPGIVLYTPRL